MRSPRRTPVSPDDPESAPRAAQSAPDSFERRGRLWLLVSFLACPCHLPLTLAAVGALLGGTALGALLRDHGLVAGLVISVAWLVGTGRGLWLVRQGERTGYACALPDDREAAPTS